MKLMPQQRKDRWVVVLAGLLAGCALPPVGLWPLALPGYALLLSRLRSGDRSELFWRVLLFLVFAWGLPFHWVLFHPIPAAAASSAGSLVAYAVLQAAWTGFFVARLPEGQPQRDLMAVLALTGFDILLARGPFAMPWLSPGLSVADATWAAGWASIAGFHGVTLALLMLAMAVMRVVADRNGRTASGMLALLLIALPFPRPILPEATVLNVRLVEPGWSPERWSAVDDTSRVARLAALVTAAEPADLVLFPETALPAGQLADLVRWTDLLSDAAGAPVLAGGILRDDPTDAARNVAMASSDPESVYAKRRLVPFAEKVPFSEWIPFFSRFSVPSGGVRAYEAGRDLAPVPLGSVEGGVLICFESLFARDARALARAGAEVIAVVTQDGWWGSDAARDQHAAFSRLLAAAVGSPVIHATVDGRSQVAGASGQAVALRGRAPVFSAALPLAQVNTPFRRTGDWPLFAIFAALLLTVIARRHPRTPA